MRLPIQRRRTGLTSTVTIGGEQFTLIANRRSDGTLGEVLIRGGKHGTSGAGLLDSYATALSVGLAYQVPLADLLRSGLDLQFTPSGRTDDPEIPRVRSVADYLARRLAIDWLPYAERAALGVYTLTERVALAGSWMKSQDPAMCWAMAVSG
jgi:ribonucleoside-diphosphate reductase alpha chain